MSKSATKNLSKNNESSYTETKEEKEESSTGAVARTKSLASSSSSANNNQVTKPATLTSKLKNLYKSQDTLPKLIEDDSIPEQKMDDYYVNLQILLSNSGNSGEKKPINMSQMFDKIEDQEAAKKILITGGAGVGKTTLLHNISYQWGKENIFTDKFDYVFKVKLKKLLNAATISTLFDLDSEDMLSKLIDLSIKDQLKSTTTKHEKITIDEIKTAIQGKALLLLDGYDEVAHLDRKDDADGVVYQIMRSIDECSVIVTSRPNAISPDKQNEFSRKIENTGLNQEESEKYIHNYFTKQQEVLVEDLDKFYTKYPKIASDKVIAKMNAYFGNKQKQKFVAINEIIKADSVKAKPIELEQESIKSLIIQHYQSTESNLKELLSSNSNLKELVTIPINLLMLCLIVSDQKSMTEFHGDFNSGTLYQEAIIWLGKRYETKYIKDLQLKDLSANAVFNLKELLVLRDIAYTEFKQGRINIDGSVIDDISSQLISEPGAIKKVYNFGLLRTEKPVKQDDEESADDEADNSDLINTHHAFIHLSFQEYLTSYQLKESLKTAIEDKAQDKIYEDCEFLANNRDNPQYLVVLKFMSGLISKEGNADLTQAFWESMTCNIEGVIDLGEDRKVELFMNLLGQVAKDKLKDIANIDKITSFIDHIVCSNLDKWQETIKASGYLSPTMQEQLTQLVASEDIDKKLQGLKLSAEFITLLGKDSKNAVFKELVELLESNPAKATESYLNLGKILPFIDLQGKDYQMQEKTLLESLLSNIEDRSKQTLVGQLLNLLDIDNQECNKLIEDKLQELISTCGKGGYAVRQAGYSIGKNLPLDHLDAEIVSKAIKEVFTSLIDACGKGGVEATHAASAIRNLPLDHLDAEIVSKAIKEVFTSLIDACGQGGDAARYVA